MAEADPALNKPTRTDSMSSPPSALHRLRRIVLMLALPLIILAVGAYYWATSGRTIYTDNAYVKRDIVSVSSEVAGRIVKVYVHENQMVKEGDPLFMIDQSPYQVALAQANAQIAGAQVSVGKLSEDFQATSVDIQAARDDVYFAQEDLNRQQTLMKQGFTTLARLQQSQQLLATATKKLNKAEADAAKARAAMATGSQVPGVNPQLASARAKRAEVELNLRRSVVRAPISGYVSQAERLQPGQMAINGLPLLSLVASERSWITANFKETDLDKMRIGQPADIALDAYPNLKLKGHVEGIGAGTGSQFSILPAQNANGNWVKVTQRIPVRIAIDSKPDRMMIAGLSAKVTVNVQPTGAGKAH